MAASEHPARPKPAFVYMVRCTGGQLYTGWTNAPAARLQAHKSGRGARYTRARGAAALAYVERCADKRSALRRAGPFPAHKDKTKPGTLSGPDGSQKGPGRFVFAVRAAANGQGAQMPPQNFVQRNRKALPVCPAGPFCVSGMLQNYFWGFSFACRSFHALMT